MTKSDAHPAGDALAGEHCVPLKGAEHGLSPVEIDGLLGQLGEWVLADDRRAISREFRFEDFHRCMAFVNAVAWIAHQEDHHPDMEVGYNRCQLRFSTHDVGGLSRNDFISAARVDRLQSN